MGALPVGNGLADKVVFAVGEENRTGVCVAVINVVNSVLFLVRTGELVLFDNAVYVVVNAGAADKTCLRPAVHDLSVDVKAVLFVLPAVAVICECVKVFACLEVNLFVIRID